MKLAGKLMLGVLQPFSCMAEATLRSHAAVPHMHLVGHRHKQPGECLQQPRLQGPQLSCRHSTVAAQAQTWPAFGQSLPGSCTSLELPAAVQTA